MANMQIWNALAPKPKSVADYAAEYDAMDQSRLTLRANALAQRMKEDQFQNSQAERNALLGFNRWHELDKPDAQAALYRASPTKAGDILKANADVRKSYSEAGHKDAQTQTERGATLQKYLGLQGEVARRVMANPSPAAAAAAIAEMRTHAKYLNLPLNLDAEEQQIAQFSSPEQFKQWAAGHALKSEQLLPQLSDVNLGGAQAFVQRDPVTGAVSTNQSLPRSMSPADRDQSQRGWAQIDEQRRHNKRTEGLKASEIAADRESGAPVLGVPAPTVFPWSNQTTQKDANKVRAAEAARGSKELEKDADAAQKAIAAAQDATRFLELNRSVSTGGVADKFTIGRGARSFDSEYAELQSITARLAPTMREPGSGATSDYDASQFERATVGVDKPRQTNESIASAVIARAKQAQDYLEFRQTYLEQNGTLQGADRYWKDYTSKNTIFDPSKPGTFEINPKRQNWRDHFAASVRQSGANSAAPQGPTRIATDAEYNQLPSGAEFIAPDGSRRRKP